MVNVFIKGVKDDAYKSAKKLAIDRNETIGEVVSDALQAFEKNEGKNKKINPLADTFGMLGPIDEKQMKKELDHFRMIREELGNSLEERIKKNARH